MPQPDRPQGNAGDTPAATRLSYRSRWAELIGILQSPRRWAVIAAAIAIADGAEVDAFGDPLVRGSEDWCRVAITAMEAPRINAAAASLPDRLPDRCQLDTALLRVWLGAPAAYADPHVATVADLVADRDWSQASDEAAQEGLHQLLEAAQDAGVFGVHGYRIEVHAVPGEDGWAARHLVVARPPVGPGVVSELLDNLKPTTPMSGVDSAIAVLSAVAREADMVLDRFDALMRRETSRGTARTQRTPFPPPTGLADARPRPGAANPADGSPGRGGVHGR